MAGILQPVFTISESDITTVVALSQHIPELVQPHGAAEYHRRLQGTPHLILVATVAGQLAGFKVGYEREGYFYSWMGGVLPAHRRQGIAQGLANAQEAWARAHGYPAITFKTRNNHKAMLLFALQNGFDIIGFEPKETPQAHRILLRKQL